MPGYTIEHEGNQFDPDGKVEVVDLKAHNEAIERDDLAAWAKKPSLWFGYLVARPNDSTGWNLTTWLGTVIGQVTRYHKYVDGFGNRMAAVTVRGNNGITYHGRYGYDWRQCIKLRRTKGE